MAEQSMEADFPEAMESYDSPITTVVSSRRRKKTISPPYKVNILYLGDSAMIGGQLLTLKQQNPLYANLFMEKRDDLRIHYAGVENTRIDAVNDIISSLEFRIHGMIVELGSWDLESGESPESLAQRLLNNVSHAMTQHDIRRTAIVAVLPCYKEPMDNYPSLVTFNTRVASFNACLDSLARDHPTIDFTTFCSEDAIKDFIGANGANLNDAGIMLHCDCLQALVIQELLPAITEQASHNSSNKTDGEHQHLDYQLAKLCRNMKI